MRQRPGSDMEQLLVEQGNHPRRQQFVSGIPGLGAITVEPVWLPRKVRQAPDEQVGGFGRGERVVKKRIVGEVLNAVYGRHEWCWITHDQIDSAGSGSAEGVCE